MNFVKYLFILIGLLYFISPVDLLRDVGLIGRVDDLILIGYLYWQYRKLQRCYQTSQVGSEWARRMFEEQKAGSQEETDGTGKKEGKKDSPHEVLGVKSGASKEEIQAAYKKLIAQYHPDKVNHLGTELQNLAHQKAIQIQKAYEDLLKVL